MSARRLAAQQITRRDATSIGDLVARLGAVQAQDYAAMKWAIGLRLDGVTEADVEAALTSGEILRTHAMRGTWQLVTPADIRWIVALVAPRLVSRLARRHRELGLDARTITRSNAVIARALAGGRQLTRAELAVALARAKISPEGQRMPHLLGCAELTGLVCSGGRRGKQVTFALVDDRAPPSPPRSRADAIAELARRYVHTRGPATDADFAWWSGLSLGDARAGLAAVEPIDLAPPRSAPRAHLLPAFDEYTVAYRDRSALLDPAHARRVNAGGGMLNPVVVLDGKVIGTWRRTLAPRRVRIELDLFARGDDAAIRAAADRFGAFLGLDAELTRATRGGTTRASRTR